MILSVTLPKVGAQMVQGSIHKLVAKPGDELKPGTPLLEVRVDLGSDKVQDCPPLFFFRIIATEKAVLRSLNIEPGQLIDVGTVLGLATSTAAEDFAGAPVRALRTTSVAIQIDPLSRR
jgi:pyruvate/2-oxoglutarate dehydrogenase complex dihydrolipoamide acyltransferase (E2) component